MDEFFDYSFTVEQARSLCYLLREKSIQNSQSLDSFFIELQKFVYNSMTVDEAESFFNEN